MIGTPVFCTLWQVNWRYRNLEPAPVIIRPGMQAKPPEVIEGASFVLTADATGDDLCAVTARTVLGGKVMPEHAFTLTHVHRVCDAKGLAQLEKHDASRWPWPGEAGAALLVAGSYDMARMGELGRRLVRAQGRINQLEAALAAAGVPLPTDLMSVVPEERTT